MAKYDGPVLTSLPASVICKGDRIVVEYGPDRESVHDVLRVEPTDRAHAVRFHLKDAEPVERFREARVRLVGGDN